VQHYSATAAGAALVPFPLLMFMLSRWSGGLVGRVGRRLPLTVGPIVAAAGLALFARPGIGGAYWTTFFPAMLVMVLGMAIVVAPLTTTVMAAVQSQHAGVASGVNNAVSRVSGLVAIAIFGILLVRAFDTRVSAALDQFPLTASARSAINRELPKLAGADLDDTDLVRSAGTVERAEIRRAIDESFVSGFRLVMIGAAMVALGGAAAGALIPS
jgi:hypothetical protein